MPLRSVRREAMLWLCGQQQYMSRGRPALVENAAEQVLLAAAAPEVYRPPSQCDSAPGQSQRLAWQRQSGPAYRHTSRWSEPLHVSWQALLSVS